jgi:serine/threonine-protein kinase
MVLGTPTYMAPEHARGAAIDIRSDLYSVGAIMYEALAGVAPFGGDNYNALLFAIQQGKPTPLQEARPDVEPELVSVVMRAMATDAELRFQTAEEMAQALAPWLTETCSSTPPESSAAVYAPTMVPLSAPAKRG